MAHLGGSSLFLGKDVGWGTRESMKDFAGVLSQYVDVIVCRSRDHDQIADMARQSGLSRDQWIEQHLPSVSGIE